MNRNLPAAIAALAIAALAIASFTTATAAPKSDLPAFDPAAFVGHPIDHPYLPLQPGTILHYIATTPDGEDTNDVEVTFDTRTVYGVPALNARLCLLPRADIGIKGD